MGKKRYILLYKNQRYSFLPSSSHPRRGSRLLFEFVPFLKTSAASNGEKKNRLVICFQMSGGRETARPLQSNKTVVAAASFSFHKAENKTQRKPADSRVLSAAAGRTQLEGGGVRGHACDTCLVRRPCASSEFSDQRLTHTLSHTNTYTHASGQHCNSCVV